jgi:hypothetical protein
VSEWIQVTALWLDPQPKCRASRSASSHVVGSATSEA